MVELHGGEQDDPEPTPLVVGFWVEWCVVLPWVGANGEVIGSHRVWHARPFDAERWRYKHMLAWANAMERRYGRENVNVEAVFEE